jgi:hypothetical protein
MNRLGRVFFLALLLAGAASLLAQIVETGTITGVVRDNSGAVIPKAQVTIRNTATGLANSTRQKESGNRQLCCLAHR